MATITLNARYLWFVTFVLCFAFGYVLMVEQLALPFLTGDEIVHCSRSDGATKSVFHCFGWGSGTEPWSFSWEVLFSTFPSDQPSAGQKLLAAEPGLWARWVSKALSGYGNWTLDLWGMLHDVSQRCGYVRADLQDWWEQLYPLGTCSAGELFDEVCDAGYPYFANATLCLQSGWDGMWDFVGQLHDVWAGWGLADTLEQLLTLTNATMWDIVGELQGLWTWCDPSGWLRSLLTMCGIEPNPGPRWNREEKAAVKAARKQQWRQQQKAKDLKRSKDQAAKEALRKGIELNPGPVDGSEAPAAAAGDHEERTRGDSVMDEDWDSCESPPDPSTCRWWGQMAPSVGKEGADRRCLACGGRLFKVHHNKKKKGQFIGYHVGDPKFDKHLEPSDDDDTKSVTSSQSGRPPSRSKPPPHGPNPPSGGPPQGGPPGGGSGPTTPPGPANPASPPVPLPMLRGYVANADDIKILARRFSCWQFTVDHQGFRWDPTIHDERLVLDRNVTRIVQPLQLASITMTSRVPKFVLAVLVVLGVISLRPCIATALARALVSVFILFGGDTWGVNLQRPEPWLLVLGSILEVVSTPFPVLLPLRFVAYASALFGLVRLAFYALGRQKVLCYCPHMVSCALAEYSNGTSMEVARTNARLKMNRLACLPLEDAVHHQVMAGSEEVLMAALETYHFFVAGPGLGATLGPL